MQQPYRQGDVLILPIALSLAAGADKEIPREAGRIVLAHGEVTGHSHAIAAENARFLINEATQRRYLEVKQTPVILRHEEHSEIQLPAGTYEIRIQREYEPGGFRQVAD